MPTKPLETHAKELRALQPLIPSLITERDQSVVVVVVVAIAHLIVELIILFPGNLSKFKSCTRTHLNLALQTVCQTQEGSKVLLQPLCQLSCVHGLAKLRSGQVWSTKQVKVRPAVKGDTRTMTCVHGSIDSGG
eukprot:scaffold100664_cov18-Tisochrysis_lutea.AAC.1